MKPTKLQEFYLKQHWKDYIFLLAISGLIISLDQLTKHLVRVNLPYQATWSPWVWLAPYARVVNWNNTGVAFGLFQGLNDVFKILAILVSAAILIYFPRIPKKEWTMRLALAMQLGGAVGNLIDRFQFGHVTDFISVGNFPVFNVADSSITVGVGFLLLGILYEDIKKHRETKDRGKEATIEPNGSIDS